MTHWKEDDWPDGDWPVRFCERCGKPVEEGNDYAWCLDCQDRGECPHGNPPQECNECFHESDVRYDERREL